MPSKQDIQEEVRGRLGDPSIEALPESQIERAIKAGLREYSRYRPETFEYTLLLMKGKTDYDLPEGVIGVADYAVAPEDMTYLFPWELEFLRYEEEKYLPPRTNRLLMHHDDDFRKNELPEYEFQVFDRGPDESPLLRMHPAPRWNMRASLVLEKAREMESLSLRDAEIVMLYIMAECLEYLGLRRSKSVRRIPTATGQLQLDDGYALRKEATMYRKRFMDALGAGAGVVYGG